MLHLYVIPFLLFLPNVSFAAQSSKDNDLITMGLHVLEQIGTINSIIIFLVFIAGVFFILSGLLDAKNMSKNQQITLKVVITKLLVGSLALSGLAYVVANISSILFTEGNMSSYTQEYQSTEKYVTRPDVVKSCVNGQNRSDKCNRY